MHDAIRTQPSSPLVAAAPTEPARGTNGNPGRNGVDHLEFVVRLFRLLGDQTRLNILLSLTGGEQNVSALCDRLALPQPTVSHHLGLMRINRLIDNRRSGKQVFYTLSDDVEILGDQAVRINVDGHKIELNLKD